MFYKFLNRSTSIFSYSKHLLAVDPLFLIMFKRLSIKIEENCLRGLQCIHNFFEKTYHCWKSSKQSILEIVRGKSH